MVIVLRVVIGDAGDAGVHVRSAQFLGADDFAGRRLHQRRPGEKDRALLADDDRLVRHRWHIGSARGARAHHHADLRDAFGRHRRLVVENAAEMIAVRKDVGLVGQVSAPGIDQVDAWQVVLARNVLRAQVLFDRHRIVRSALDGRVVADDHAFATRDPAKPGDDPRRSDGIVVHPVRGELRELQKWRTGIEECLHPLARQQPVAPCGAAPRVGAVVLTSGNLLLEVGQQRGERVAVFPERDRGCRGG
jgi:hypothetical protein